MLKSRTVVAGDRDEAQRACEHLKRIDVWHHDLVADKLAVAKAAPATVSLDDLTIATVDSTAPAKDVKALLATVLAAQTDATRTNGIVYIALAANAPDEALTAAKRVLAPTQNPQFLDTLAECFHMTGDRDQALATEDAALKLISEHGVSGTSLQMIADEMGVTKAAVYRQFKTKEEIVIAIT